jgi:H+/Cl- antiporter ClcA
MALAPRRLAVVLALAAAIGVVAALASWAFLEGSVQLTNGLYDHVPGWLGFDDTPRWWSLPVLALGGLFAGLAIARLPGHGGHIPANGLNATGLTLPRELPGVLLAALASISFGAVLGPEAPLIALGGALGLMAHRMLAREQPPEFGQLLAACATFSAVSLIFGSPIIAAVILIEATGLGGEKLPRVLVPGLLAAGIGSLVSIGLGSWTGLSSSAYAIGALHLPSFDRPSGLDFLWAIALAAVVAVGAAVIMRSAGEVLRVTKPRPVIAGIVAGVAVSGLAIAFSYAAGGHGPEEVLFSGESALDGLVAHPEAWSIGAVILLLAFKGVAWSISLAAFRGGPTFPAIFLGAAAGVGFSHLPGFDLTPAVAVGIGAGVAAILRLPLSAVVLATMLTAEAGLGASPLIIVGVVVSYLVTVALRPRGAEMEGTASPSIAKEPS